MGAIIRPLLIRMGIGRQYFQASDHPEVRARATLAYVNKILRKSIPLGWFASRISDDCITPELKIHQGVTQIYKAFILEFIDEKQFPMLKTHFTNQAFRLNDQPLKAQSIYTLINALGLNDPFPVV